MKFYKQLLQVLCPYGKWQHPRGMQTVDEESARRLRRSMTFSNPFRQIPIYIGHPDDSPRKSAPTPVGKITKILQTHDGIAVVANYDESTREKILDKKISAMSPRWQMEKLDDGTFRPVRLLSVGLTNNPNIPASGTVICAKPNVEALSAAVKKLTSMATLCSKNAERARLCAKSVENIAQSINETGIESRLKTVAKQTQDGKSKKKTPREISKIAREMSDSTGVAYTKAFAALKLKNS